MRIREATDLSACVAALRAAGLAPGELGGITRLYVDPSARRQGLARALLQTATDRAVAHGLQPVLDVVADSRPAIALYKRAGWQLAGTQTATWANADGPTPVMRCYLRPRRSAHRRTQGGEREASWPPAPRFFSERAAVLAWLTGYPVASGSAGPADTADGQGNRYASCVRGVVWRPERRGA